MSYRNLSSRTKSNNNRMIFFPCIPGRHRDKDVTKYNKNASSSIQRFVKGPFKRLLNYMLAPSRQLLLPKDRFAVTVWTTMMHHDAWCDQTRRSMGGWNINEVTIGSFPNPCRDRMLIPKIVYLASSKLPIMSPSCPLQQNDFVLVKNL